MARTLDRPTVHPEVHPDIHPDVHPGVDEFIKKTLDEHEVTTGARRPVRWMRWLAAMLIGLVAAGVAIWALPGDDPEYAVPRTADGAERWIESTTPTYGVPRTADGAEGWIESTIPEHVVPRSADGKVMWFSYLTPQVPRTADGVEGWNAAVQPVPEYAVPRSADGKVMWFSYLTPQVPRTADGAEGWILGSESGVTPMLTQFRPIGQVPDGVTGEITFLPVSPPRPVQPGEQVLLTVQPVFRQAA